MGDGSVVFCPNAHAAEIRELPAPAPSRPSDSHSSQTSLAILAHFQLPPKPGHTGDQLPKGEEASATGDGMNNWDMSTGTRWGVHMACGNPSGAASRGWLGSPGMPQCCGIPVLLGITAAFWYVPVRDSELLG